MACRWHVRCNITIVLVWIFLTVYLVFQLDEALKRNKTLMLDIEENSEKSDLEIKEGESKCKNMMTKLTSDYENELNETIHENRQSTEKLEREKVKLMKSTKQRSQQTIRREKLRRRIINNHREIQYNLYGYLNKIEINKTEPEKLRKAFLERFNELLQVTEIDFEDFFSLDNATKTIQNNLANGLSDVIQKRLYNLQNPKNCNSARKLVCTLEKKCGYACLIHHLLYCFMIAYSTNRTMYINTSIGKYSTQSWTAYFPSLTSNCTFKHQRSTLRWSHDHQNHQVVLLDATLKLQKQKPKNTLLSVPKEFLNQILLFHGKPFVWWIGQFCKYIFKYNPNVELEITKMKKRLGFKKPIVGIQIRRTDKVPLEAAYHSIEEYMYWVDLYYKKLQLKQKVVEKRVFISTDDIKVLSELKAKYPDYIFIADYSASVIAHDLKQRYSVKSLHGIISDIELLSETDYVVCTFSSNVCRLAYEMMNSKHTDASDWFKSLDDVFFFTFQPDYKVKIIREHEAKDDSELNLKVGDVVGVRGNHWNGDAKGFLYKSRKTGLFPAYKGEDLFDITRIKR